MNYVRQALLLGLLILLVALAGLRNNPPHASAEIAVAFAAGGYHTCAVTSGGALKCWGGNYNGQLGDSTTTTRMTPIGVVGLSSGVAAVGTGSSHTCAVTTTGAAKCWGGNQSGQLGDGTTTESSTAVDVLGMGSGVAAIAGGGSHTCAIATGGALKCWGSNQSGQLGDGTTTNRTTPVDVTGLGSGVAAVAAGYFHTCGLTTGGGVKCWGKNDLGQLGDGTTTDSSTAVDVLGMGSGVAAIAGGGSHTCAIATGGVLKCWGGNYSGELGDGTTTNSATAVEVAGLGSGVAAVATGPSHTCAVSSAGTAKCWGRNYDFQLGDGTRVDRALPVDVLGLGPGVAAVAGGGYHTCALTTGGILKCWGYNGAGALAIGETGYRATPVAVNGLSSGVAAVMAGSQRTCVLTTAGGARCWGQNNYGQLGDGSAIYWTAPVDVSGLSSGVAALLSGSSHSCAITAAGGLKCWGLNSDGQLGDGTTIDRSTPVDVSGLSSSVAAAAAGGLHTCAIITGGLKCWGRNYNGQLGDGTTTNTTTAVDATGLGSGVAAIAAGGSHTCALTTGGGVKCWGYNQFGQLGDATTTDRWTPVDVSGLSSGVAAVAAGWTHTCAVMTNGGVKCWGYNAARQLGDGTTTNRSTPVDVVGLGVGVSALGLGEVHSCALTTFGGVKCWGNNAMGELGDGTTTPRTSPVDASGLTSGVANVSAGGAHTCATITGGAVKCWGRNTHGELGDGTALYMPAPYDVPAFSGPGGTPWAWGQTHYGQLGEGSTVFRTTPVQLMSLTDVTAVAGGDYHSLALKTDQTVWAWGANGSGQLGNGRYTNLSGPVQVSGLAGVTAVDGGGYHSLALMSNQTVRAWGANFSGQLGDGSTTTRPTPVTVSGLADAVGISGGYAHSLAVRSNGTVRAWGWNRFGQLGNGAMTTAPVTLSVAVSGLVDATAVAAGYGHSLALRSNGTVVSWGWNNLGQLGDGTRTTRLTPVPVTGLSNIIAIAAGYSHSLALQSDGTVWRWGRDGANSASSTPVPVMGLPVPTGVTAISAGWYHSVAVKSDGTVRAWGANSNGQLGNGTTTSSPAPVQASGLMGASGASGGVSHTLVVKSDGTVWAWGFGSYGQLGDGTPLGVKVPVQASGLSGIVAVSAGNNHSLALKADGTVWAWGLNTGGQLGSGSYSVGSATPIQVSGLTGVVAISAGQTHSLALKSDGKVWAWGRNSEGQLGNNTFMSSATPVQVSGLADAVAIAAGGYHSLAARSGGSVVAWGYNGQGQLGDGTSMRKSLPTAVTGLSNGVSVAAGLYHSLALKSDGTVGAWGNNGQGQLGDGTTTNRSTAVPVGGLGTVSSVAAGLYHSLAVKSDGTAWAWGYNGSGQLGDGTTTSRTAPVLVLGISGVAALAGGANHSLAARSDGTAWAWGYNYSGQLGDGTTMSRNRPARVIGLQGVISVAAGGSHSLTVAGGTLSSGAPDGTTVAATANQTVSTGSAPTPDDPVETSVTTPKAGTVSIQEAPTTTPGPSGFQLLGQQVTVTAPAATDITDPLVIVFRIDASLIPIGHNENTIQVFKNGALVPACSGAMGTASPDPCVSARAIIAGGDVQITVLTLTASDWNFGVDDASDFDSDGVPDVSDNCPALANATQSDIDGDAAGNPCDDDVDGDGSPNEADDDDDADLVDDSAESACGADPLDPANRPELLGNNSDDDGDGQTDEPLPSGSEAYDCDGDGFTGSTEQYVFSAPDTQNDQNACGDSWPPDLVESNNINISDVLALKPVFGTAVPPTSARYDIVVSGSINISDVLQMKPFFGQVCVP